MNPGKSTGIPTSSRAKLEVGPTFRARAGNFVIFQAVWAACVLGATRGHLWLGPAAGLLLLPINLLFFSRKHWRGEVRLWLVVGLTGWIIDSGLLALHVMAFPPITRIAPDALLSAWMVPPWLVVLWIAVGTSLRTSLGWLRGRPALAAALGAVGGPFSFWSGTRLGATELPLGWLSFTLLGLEYALILPWLLRLAYPPGTETALDKGLTSTR